MHTPIFTIHFYFTYYIHNRKKADIWAKQIGFIFRREIDFFFMILLDK